MIAENLYRYLQKISALSAQTRHRRLIVVNAKANELDEFAKAIYQQNRQVGFFKNSLFYGDLSEAISERVVGNYQHHLGTENHLVVYREQDFHPDAFCALTGTLIAGGLCIVLNTSDESPTGLSKSLFSDRLDEYFKKACYQVIQFDGIEQLNFALQNTELSQQYCSEMPKIVDEEQSVVVTQLVSAFAAKQKAVVALTANRGRGKSTALAIALAQFLFKTKNKTVVLTAPHQRCLSIFYKHLLSLLPEANRRDNEIRFLNNTIKFLPIDVINEQQPKADLVIVDEAAGIPIYLLKTVLANYKRSVFSSTVHGYEGAGRGFSIKFLSELKEPDYLPLTLNQPIRWAEDDPIEQLTFDLFLLNAKLPQFDKVDVSTTEVVYQCIDINTLIENGRLAEVYALLVSAHYQTKPSDLKLLMNDPNVKIVIASHRDKIIGVVMLMIEERVSDDDIKLVRSSKRQLKGCFIPQSLYRHGSYLEAFKYRYMRVVRIAVHPQAQSLGIGTSLLSYTLKLAKQSSFDFVGTTFGATSQLLSFWSKNGFLPVRLGVTKDKASGEYSVLMLNALSPDAAIFKQQLREYFAKSFVHMLPEQYRTVSASLVCLLIWLNRDLAFLEYSEHDAVSVKGFVSKERQYHTCSYSLRNWLLHFLTEHLDECSELLISRVLQRLTTEELNAKFHLTGKKQLDNQLVNDVAVRFHLP